MFPTVIYDYCDILINVKLEAILKCFFYLYLRNLGDMESGNTGRFN